MWNCKYALEYMNQFMKYLWFHDVLLNLSVSGIWDSSNMTIPQRKEDLTRSLDTGWVLVTTGINLKLKCMGHGDWTLGTIQRYMYMH